MKKILFILIFISSLLVSKQAPVQTEHTLLYYECETNLQCLKLLKKLKSQKNIKKLATFSKKLCEIPDNSYFLIDDEIKFQACDTYLTLYENGKIRDTKSNIIKFAKKSCKFKGIRCGMYGEYIFHLAKKETDNKNKKDKFDLACELGFEPGCYMIF